MNKDHAIIKALADINLRPEPELTPEQEDMLRLALNPEEQFLNDVERIFTKTPHKE